MERLKSKRLKVRAKDLVDMIILKNNLAFMRKYGLDREELKRLKTSLRKGHWGV